MNWVNRQVAQCDKCGHEWLPAEGREPKRCPQCKARTWDGTNRTAAQTVPAEVQTVPAVQKVPVHKGPALSRANWWALGWPEEE
jgi:tRNA(Ile2) C34 agmatinyltransferase TiaS